MDTASTLDCIFVQYKVIISFTLTILDDTFRSNIEVYVIFGGSSISTAWFYLDF